RGHEFETAPDPETGTVLHPADFRAVDPRRNTHGRSGDIPKSGELQPIASADYGGQVLPDVAAGQSHRVGSLGGASELRDGVQHTGGVPTRPRFGGGFKVAVDHEVSWHGL